MAAIRTDEITRVQEILGLVPSELLEEKLCDAVFVCLDCEAFEFAQNKVTEVGVSVLDTRTIRNVQLGDKASGWLPKIQSAHYRIIEYQHLVNKRYVKGCPDSFIFGNSCWIKRNQAKDLLGRIFNDPANVLSHHASREEVPQSGRNIILVGHGLASDSDYLEHLQFSLDSVQSVQLTVDTQRLVSPKKRSVGLKRLLKALDVEPQFLHNGGNDAAYTLQALVLIAVSEHQTPGALANRLALSAPLPKKAQNESEQCKPT